MQEQNDIGEELGGPEPFFGYKTSKIKAMLSRTPQDSHIENKEVTAKDTEREPGEFNSHAHTQHTVYTLLDLLIYLLNPYCS